MGQNPTMVEEVTSWVVEIAGGKPVWAKMALILPISPNRPPLRSVVVQTASAPSTRFSPALASTCAR